MHGRGTIDRARLAEEREVVDRIRESARRPNILPLSEAGREARMKGRMATLVRVRRMQVVRPRQGLKIESPSTLPDLHGECFCLMLLLLLFLCVFSTGCVENNPYSDRRFLQVSVEDSCSLFTVEVRFGVFCSTLFCAFCHYSLFVDCSPPPPRSFLLLALGFVDLSLTAKRA